MISIKNVKRVTDITSIQKVSGQITIYAALSFMIVVSLIITCVQYAMQTQMFAELDMSTRMSIESVFAGYHNRLQQEFDILALSPSQCNDEKFQYYAHHNIDGMANVNHIQYRSSYIQDKKYMTDNDGEGLEKQILLHMKNNIYTDIINKTDDIEKLTKKSETLNKLTDEVMDLDEQMVVLDQSALKLIELIEGLKTDHNGMVLVNGMPELVQGSFAKQIILKDISQDTIRIYNNHVYHAVCLSPDRYVNVNKLIDDLVECIGLYSESLEENNISEMNSCAFIYQNNINQFYNTVISVKEKSRQAMDMIEEYNSGKENIYKQVDKCENDIKDSQDILDAEIFDGLLEEVASFKEGETKAVEMFLVEDLWENLNDNDYILSDVCERLEKLKQNTLENMKSEELEELKVQYHYLKEKIQGISNENLVIDYSKVCFDSDNKGIDGISQLRQLLTKGIADIVLADFSLSEGSYNYDDLAESHMSTAGDKKDLETQNIIDEGLINQYITNQFSCFTDIQGNEHHSMDLWCSLGYPLEYIVAGKKSDKENISEIILKLSVLREGINIAHLMTDYDKRNEAQALAISLMGFTGNAAIIKAAQFLIMGVWAYGESMLDIRRLFQGEEISFLKTKEDWKLSLQNLLSFQFELSKHSDSNKTASTKRWSEGKLGYKDYLTILLMTMNKKLKLFRTMSVMELRMIALGETNFRMKQYVYQATGTIGVQYGDKKLCERSEQYGYI